MLGGRINVFNIHSINCLHFDSVDLLLKFNKTMFGRYAKGIYECRGSKLRLQYILIEFHANDRYVKSDPPRYVLMYHKIQFLSSQRRQKYSNNTRESQRPSPKSSFLKFLQECEDNTFENQFKITRKTFQVSEFRSKCNITKGAQGPITSTEGFDFPYDLSRHHYYTSKQVFLSMNFLYQ